MYIRYIHKLCDMHLQAENYTGEWGRRAMCPVSTAWTMAHDGRQQADPPLCCTHELCCLRLPHVLVLSPPEATRPGLTVTPHEQSLSEDLHGWSK